MLISRASEANAKERKRERAAERRKRDSPRDYQTANELFEIMAKNHPFDENVNDSLSASDLVILYKNIEMGTKLMSEVGELKRRAPNQYVETIVYKEEGDSDGSDCEAYSSDDLRHAVLVNNERIDLLSNPPSLENTLCHKLGDLEMRASNISTQYDKHFLFKDPYIKEQLRNLSMLKPTSNDFDNTMLPTSLLDYICCKRLEDNYNFYMDNVIKYVKHTIEQLRRISNGDYLTDKAKEKWREVESTSKNRDINNAKILTTSASIPLQVERKVNGLSTTWDDIIHSEVDIRSLSKILEKKIVVEIPKLICGSYKLFSEYCSDNLVFSCTTENQPKADAKKEDPRLDVVLQLGRSESGQVMSNISSIMVWQANPSMTHDDSLKPALLPIPYSEVPKVECEQEEFSPKIVEIEDAKEESDVKEETDVKEESHVKEETDVKEESHVQEDSDVKEEPVQNLDDFQETVPEINQNQNTEAYDTSLNTNHEENPFNYGFNDFTSSETSESLALRDVSDMRVDPRSTEAAFRYQSPEDLMFSLQCMNISSLPEESGEDAQKLIKRKSPTKVRVKSPYENKSYLIEERKRKKLLEIRERREKRKIAMGESCKISKHKYGKGPIMPRPSSSVTKLSITNKSFYNSIYGQNGKDVDVQSKCKPCNKEKRDLTLTPALEQLGCEQGSEMLSPDINNKKYINRSYYLDDAVTEIMYAEPSECSSDVRELFSTSTSVVSSDLAPTQTIDPTTSSSPYGKLERFDETQETSEVLKNNKQASLSSLGNIPEDEPSTSTKNEELWKDEPKKSIPIECRKSIDKIYGLIRKLGSGDTLECKSTRSKCTIDSNKVETTGGKENSIQCSDSGTSLKHLLASSNASSFSFDKAPATDNANQKEDFNKKGDGLTTVVPKVIISAKQQAMKHEVDKVKKERKKVTINPIRVPENPLKAISQLLHEFDNVQKTRQKLSTDSKGNKKPEVSFDSRHIPRGSPTKNRMRLESYEVPKFENLNDKTKAFMHKERRKPMLGSESSKGYHVTQNEDRHIDRTTRKKLADIIDEVKEAKGEAVRGPSKPSRLNTLAQPKKSYVQAMSEEYQTKYGRNVMSERLQRLASAGSGERGARGRPRRGDAPAPPSPPPRHQAPALPPLERGPRHRRPASASPEKPAPDAAPYKHAHAPGAPVTHFKNKMVAVESYLKSHYGRAAAAGADGGGEQPRGAGKARVPLVPHDLELSSLSLSSPTGEEATAIGNKLHHIINSMIMPKPATLSALHESPENGSSLCQDDHFDDDDYHSRIDNHSSVDSDFRADIFEDKHVKTAVQNFLGDKHEETITDAISEINAFKHDDVEAIKTAIELQELESALHRRMSVGAFSKRLRLKNLTITPKQSMQQVFLLQSGDADSLLLHSTVSQTLKLSISRSISEKDICELQSLMKPHTNWNVTNIPMQITTVGYAFPQYNSIQCGSNSSIEPERDVLKTDSDLPMKDKSLCDISYRGALPDNNNVTQNVEVNCYEGDSAASDTYYIEPSDKSESIPAILNVANAEEKKEIMEVANPINKSVDKVKKLSIDGDLDHISYTSSLDILVGLLTEIQNITACHISNTENYIDDKDSKTLENMLINNSTFDCPVEVKASRELISINSLDRLRQLDSNPSIYSLYISNDESVAVDARRISNLRAVLCNEKPIYVDKEVTAEFPRKEFTSTFTDVPSLFPITITHSTNITNSLFEILSKPSTQTIFSINDSTTTYSDFSECQSKIIEIPQPVTEGNEKLPLAVPCIADISKTKNVVMKMRNVKNDKTAVIPYNRNTRLLKNISVDSLDNDPMLKMKRDILVTVYSMLVLTVFAALSFPDILYYA